MAREDGGRREELFDSTGVLFRLPTADILSIVALELKRLMLEKVVFEVVSGFSKCETKLQI